MYRLNGGEVGEMRKGANERVIHPGLDEDHPTQAHAHGHYIYLRKLIRGSLYESERDVPNSNSPNVIPIPLMYKVLFSELAETLPKHNPIISFSLDL
jgi:hypothetical protein